MFGLICKSLGRTIKASAVHELHFLQIPLKFSSLRFHSSNTNTNQQSFTVSYLINKCGFSPESALSASKIFHFETPDKPDSILRFFKNHGFSETQIINLVKRYPRILVYDSEKTLSPKLQFLDSKGVSNPDVAKIISSCPWILARSLENQLVPSFNFFENLFKSIDTTIATIKLYPNVLTFKLEKVFHVINILRDNGVPKMNVTMFVRQHPRSLLTTPERFSKVVEEVKAMGFDPSMSEFVLAVKVLNSLSTSTWVRKLGMYGKWGLSQEEILAAFRKWPGFMAVSDDKILEVMDLFINKLGWEASFIGKRPYLLKYSLEHRLIPRASVLQFLVCRGLIERSFRSTAFFMSKEKAFLQKFINHHAESAQILKLYQEKLDLS